MPAVSASQQRLFAMAEHGGTSAKARKLRATMTAQDLHDFAATPTANLPERVKPKRTLKQRMTG